MHSGDFRCFDQANGDLLNHDDFLGDNVLLLQRPFELAEEEDCFLGSQCVHDKQDVMIDDGRRGAFRLPGTSPRWIAFQACLRKASTTVAE
jgi:hypothetical protein